MKHSLYTIFGIIFFSLLTLRFTCGVERLTSIYQFSEKFTLSPYKKVYTINDTIKLKFTTADKSLYDALSNRKVSTDSTSFTLPFQYVQCSPAQFTVDTLVYTVSSAGSNQGLQIFNGYNTLVLNTTCDNSTSYKLELAFVPKRTGIYRIILPSATLESCASRRNRFPLSTLFFSFDLNDSNKDVYLSIPESQRIGSAAVERELDWKTAFAFKVE